MNRLRLLLVFAFMASCHSAFKMVSISKQEHEEGKELLAHSDCMTCHMKEMRLIGPSFMQVTKKYAPTDRNIEKLSKKIISGGSGNWGPISMTPHPDLTKEDAATIVKYILSIKNFQ